MYILYSGASDMARETGADSGLLLAEVRQKARSPIRGRWSPNRSPARERPERRSPPPPSFGDTLSRAPCNGGTAETGGVGGDVSGVGGAGGGEGSATAGGGERACVASISFANRGVDGVSGAGTRSVPAAAAAAVAAAAVETSDAAAGGCREKSEESPSYGMVGGQKPDGSCRKPGRVYDLFNPVMLYQAANLYSANYPHYQSDPRPPPRGPRGSKGRKTEKDDRAMGRNNSG